MPLKNQKPAKKVAALLAIFLVLPILIGLFTVKFRQLFPWSIRSRIEMITAQGQLSDKRLGLARPDQEIVLRSQGLKIAGDLYLPSRQNGGSPGIVMLHGSSRWGRKVAMGQLLAKRLAARGYVVLLIDIRGFGDSDDPEELASVNSWDPRPDIAAAITFLAGSELVDNRALYLVGHSMGASYAIKAAIEDERIKKIVAIGPARRFLERFPAEKGSFLARFSRDRRLARLIPLEVYYDHSVLFTVENTFDYFQQEASKPLLLIDGELEAAANKSFLAQYYARMAAAHRYVTIAATGHYFNVVGFEKFENFPVLRDLYIYDQKVIEDGEQAIDHFLKL